MPRRARGARRAARARADASGAQKALLLRRKVSELSKAKPAVAPKKEKKPKAKAAAKPAAKAAPKK
jgi:hypothetical protein